MKEKLRKEYRKKRKSLSKEEVFNKSKKILEKLEDLKEFKSAKKIAFYYSVNNEVYTHPLIEKYLDGKEIYLPKTKENNLIFCKIESFKDLKKGKYTPEPKFGEVSNEFDLIIVPGIVFDERKHRIGYGSGYYDNALKALNCSKIGLCYDFQIIDKIPNDEWDEKLDLILSEKRNLNKNKKIK